MQLDEKEFSVATWTFLNNKRAGKYTETLSSVEGMYLPLSGRGAVYGVLGIKLNEQTSPTNDQLIILEDMVKQLALGIEREILNDNLNNLQISEATEKVYKTLLNSVSHELKTPLAAILGSATALQDDKISGDSTSVKDLGDQIQLGANRMLLLIQNLLDMSRIESGKLTLNLAQSDPKDIINNVLNEIENYFGKRQLKIEYDPPDFPLVIVDSVLLEQALKNIIQNAFVYSPEEFPIEITCKRNLNYSLSIIIRDHGPGLPEENPSVVFQKFYRANSTKPGGSGLGLTIAKHMVEMHGGIIQAHNHPHAGAVFIINIPPIKESGTKS